MKKKHLPFYNTGIYLRDMRIKSGLLQVDVKNILGFNGNNSYVSMVESGTRMFSIPQLKKLIKPLKLNKLDLVCNYESDLISEVSRKIAEF